MQPFDLQNQTRFVFGPGSIHRLGELAAEYRPRCVLVVSDRGIMEAGHDAAALQSLKQAGLNIASFHDFAENPTSAMVDAGVRRAAEVKPDLLVGLGRLGGAAAWTVAKVSILSTRAAARFTTITGSVRPPVKCCR